jgi:hypothetical protein
MNDYFLSGVMQHFGVGGVGVSPDSICTAVTLETLEKEGMSQITKERV